MENHGNQATEATPADSEFIENLADVVAQMIPGVSPAEATHKLEYVGLALARGDLYKRAIEIVQGVPGP
ncbi:hypothetical protein ACNPON_17495 [Glutamicibacter sp. AGC13]